MFGRILELIRANKMLLLAMNLSLAITCTMALTGLGTHAYAQAIMPEKCPAGTHQVGHLCLPTIPSDTGVNIPRNHTQNKTP
ncbi:MAG: hypothetical protein WBZ36_14875 [Candidatus Nitrosopolaris sp.]